jgi:hypothetical protein
MNAFIRLARPGYTVAFLALILGLGFLITGSAEAGVIIAVLEGAFCASLQYFKDRRGGRVQPHS